MHKAITSKAIWAPCSATLISLSFSNLVRSFSNTSWGKTWTKASRSEQIEGLGGNWIDKTPALSSIWDSFLHLYDLFLGLGIGSGSFIFSSCLDGLERGDTNEVEKGLVFFLSFYPFLHKLQGILSTDRLLRPLKEGFYQMPFGIR